LHWVWLRRFANTLTAWGGLVWLVLPAGSAAEVPGPDGPVLAIRRVGDSVYVGGRFTRIGGVEAGSIARWNGPAGARSGTG
jgi:hypothetical protein